MTPKPGFPPCSGSSMEGTYLLAMRGPAYRRHDSYLGFPTEFENRVGDAKGKGTKWTPHEAEGIDASSRGALRNSPGRPGKKAYASREEKRRFRPSAVARNPWRGVAAVQWAVGIIQPSDSNAAGRRATRSAQTSRSNGVPRSFVQARATSAPAECLSKRSIPSGWVRPSPRD